MGKKSRRDRAKGKSKPHEIIPRLVGYLRCCKRLVSEADIKGVCAALAHLDDLFDCEDVHTARSSVVALFRAGGVTDIITLMRENPQVVTIQYLGSGLLHAAVEKGTGGIEQAVVLGGGVSTVIATVNNFIGRQISEDDDEERVAICIESSLLLLQHLSANEHVDAVRIAGVSRMAVEILRHLSSFRPEDYQAPICKDTFMLIWEIQDSVMDNECCLVSSFLDEIISCGGIPTILAAMRQFPGDSDVQMYGSVIMNRFSDQDFGGAPSVVLAAGGDAVMEDVLEQNEQCPEVVEEARKTLHNLQDVVPQCHSCGRKSQDMMVCNRCDVVWYCSDECLVRDWKNHKDTCNAARWKPLNNIKQACLEATEESS